MFALVVLVAVVLKYGGAPNGACCTVTKSVGVPAPPAVNVMLRVPLPDVIVPPVMLQEKVAPVHSWTTEAVALAPEYIGDGTLIVTFGFGLTVTVVDAD